MTVIGKEIMTWEVNNEVKVSGSSFKEGEGGD